MQPYETENVPSEPYAIGGHHFTNGSTWVEKLTQNLHIPKSGHPSEVSPGQFRNYAVGRSRARDVLLDDVFNEVNLTTQVDNFLADENNQAPGEALYIIWIGSNDVADALFAPNPGDIMGAALLNTFTQIQRLYFGRGASFPGAQYAQFFFNPPGTGFCFSLPRPCSGVLPAKHQPGFGGIQPGIGR